MKLESADRAQLQEWESSLAAEYEAFKAQKLNLDLTRGKPSAEQLDLSNDIDRVLNGNFIDSDGVDTRNYGGLDGIAEAKALGAEMLGVPAQHVLAGGNSSLTMMYQCLSMAMYNGLNGADSAWHTSGDVRFLCPVPGYDRHFSACEHLGIKMQTVAMTPGGPDMDAVEAAIKADDRIKGMWCVPRFSNPSGVVYSDAVVERIASLGKIAGPDFRVFWDNAYAIHALEDTAPALANIWELSKAAGCEDSIIQFASTSKITLAGAGVAFLAASDNNLKHIKHALSFMTIGPDKVNQLRHARFFAAEGSLQAHMKKHAEIIKPRFATVLARLEDAFADGELGRWESAQGGYFISFDTRPGLAKIVVKLAADAGVKLTPAGATFPYGDDPQDSNIRLAPTVPTVAQVDTAMHVFVNCVKLASVRQALASE